MTRNATKNERAIRSDEPDMESLWQMIQTMRPANTKTEEDFIRRYIDATGAYEDGYGNRILRIGDAPIMFSSHTDTVHSKEGTQRVVQRAGLVKLSELETVANCLGADCTAGVWLMLECIRARKSGLYVFHREEEIGGHGSSWIAANTPELLDGIQACVALDRKGTDSVITHQYGGRCASDDFAWSLGKQFRGYRPDDTGSFTDSANYTHLIPECSNLSIGYENAHQRTETLAYLHLLDVRDSLLKLDHRKLAIRRKPEARQTYVQKYSAGAWYSDDFDDLDGNWNKPTNGRAARNVREFCQLYPDEVADMLSQYGITVAELYESAPFLD